MVSGSYAYVADAGGGLRIIDISDPSSPFEVSHVNLTHYAHDVVISGSYAYIANGERGLRVINISDPLSPYQIGGCDTPDYAYSVDVSGSYAYIADKSGGLRIIDVSLPYSPSEASCCSTPYSARDVTVSGIYAYVADGFGGLRVIDISNPLSPYEFGHYITAYFSHGVTASGSYIYVADEDAGLQIYENLYTEIEEEPESLLPVESLFFQNVPNPFRENTLISYRLSAIGEVSLKIYDASGRLVSTLVDDQVGSAQNSAVFNGGSLQPGIYFARLQSGDYKSTRMLVLIR